MPIQTAHMNTLRTHGSCYNPGMVSRAGAVAEFLFLDVVGSLFRFPVWWYTTGLARVARALLVGLRFRLRSYAFGIWMRNFFVPMYGQYDFTGRAISVGMRLVILIGRFIAFTLEAIFDIFLLVLWMLLPIAFAVLLLMNLGSGWIPSFV